MCGRYQLALAGLTIANLLDAEYAAGSVQPTWNAAPGQVHPVLALSGAGNRMLAPAQWGLVPGWAVGTPDVRPLVNARVETVATRSSFREATRNGRVLVPVTGFYEWSGARAPKVPWSIRVDGQAIDPSTGERLDHLAAREEVVEPFLLAAVLDDRTGTFAVLTTEPNELCAAIHHRMPVILEGEEADAWLAAPPQDAAMLAASLGRAFPAERMDAWPVSRAVNAAGVDGPELVEPVPVDTPSDPEPPTDDPQQSLL